MEFETRGHFVFMDPVAFADICFYGSLFRCYGTMQMRNKQTALK